MLGRRAGRARGVPASRAHARARSGGAAGPDRPGIRRSRSRTSWGPSTRSRGCRSSSGCTSSTRTGPTRHTPSSGRATTARTAIRATRRATTRPPSSAPYWDRSIVDPEYTEALYRQEVTYLDKRLADLFAHPRFRDATIAFTSDHGETLSRGAMPFDHRGLSPSTLSVPLILRSPGLQAGMELEEPVRQIDLGRTLLDLAGLGASEFPGRSLSAALRASSDPRPRFALESFALSASVRLEDWMLVMKLRLRSGERRALRHAVFLYDVRDDPDLERNVASKHPEKAAELRRLLVEWLMRAEPTGWSSAAALPDEEVEEQLAALGYASGEGQVVEGFLDPECACRRCEAFR
ncbi:MAG: sulfatase-like hydrolase/transferase [bacterium]|nr:sulfatase-like hydrolase/transferase [bacterium]